MNAIQRLKATINYALENGVKDDLVPYEIALERMDICRACEYFRESTVQCKVCLCFLSVKTKLVYDPVQSIKQGATIKTKCPKDKWGEFN